jgi:hypothetical protein
MKGRRGMHIDYWWESQKERDHLEDHDVGAWITLRWMIERLDELNLFSHVVGA